MNVRNDRYIAAALTQTSRDVLQIARVFQSRRGNAHNFAADRRQLHCLLDRHLGVHRVARDHRLDADRIRPAHTDFADHHLAGDAAMIIERINAIVHNAPNLRNRGQGRNAVRYGFCVVEARSGSSLSSLFLMNGRSCTSKNVT